jgi:proline iminopeptidase
MNYLSIEKEILTPFGLTNLKLIGTGPKMFVLHGGPGFDHRYLISGLASLKEKRTLIFYDQPKANQVTANKQLSPLDIFSHFRWLSKEVAEEEAIGVVAHSWGSLVLIGALLDEKLIGEPCAKFNEGILINPVPVCWEKYAQCAKNNLKRITLADKVRLIWHAFFVEDGAKAMKFLLPYYVVKKDSMPTEHFPLDKKTYFSIDKQLKGFDYRSGLEQLPPLSAIMGSEDFITQDLTDDLSPHLENKKVMAEVSHFPFWEEKEKFTSIIHSLLK